MGRRGRRLRRGVPLGHGLAAGDPGGRAAARTRKPVVNLIQHVRHACENDPLGRQMLLRHSAIRICVSPEVERAILATGQRAGPGVHDPRRDRRGSGGAAGRRRRSATSTCSSRRTSSRRWARRSRAGSGPAGGGSAGRHAHPARRPDRPDGTRAGDRADPEPQGGLLPPAIEAWRRARWWSARTASATARSACDGENSFRPAY